jgi:phage terminase small subunit
MEKKLTDKQRRFVAEYPVDLNATQAAIRAGYSETTARQQGQRLLTNVDIRQAIDEAEAERLERIGVRAERVLEELARLGFSNMLDYLRISDEGDPFVDLSQMSREQAAAVQEVTVEDFLEGRGENAREVRRVKFKLADKKSSLELLGKHLKLFTERHEHSGAGGGPIQVIEVGASVTGDGDEDETGASWP